MADGMDKGYNEGRLAFRRYFAKYGPNVKQNDPRMPPNPYVGYSGVMWLNGFESELRRHVAFNPVGAHSHVAPEPILPFVGFDPHHFEFGHHPLFA